VSALLILASFPLSVVYLLWVLDTAEHEHLDATLFFGGLSLAPWAVALVGFWVYGLCRRVAGTSV
jgi:hypothetical protein